MRTSLIVTFKANGFLRAEKLPGVSEKEKNKKNDY